MSRRGIEYHRLRDVVPAPANPKLHAIDAIADSVDEFGFVEPILRDDRTGRLIAGHGRLETLTRKRDAGEEPPDGVTVDDDGEWLLPVIVGWSSNSDAQAAAYLTIANRHPELGGWDPEGLQALLDDLPDDLRDLVGFSDEDVDAMLAELTGDGDDTTGPDQLRTTDTTLADRFGVPPFSVLDARQGYWRTRKREWLSRGIVSDDGRGDRLAFKGQERADPTFYDQKNAAEARLGRELTTQEFIRDHYRVPTQGVGTGTSIFDPVLCEIAYRWFSPPGGHVLDPFAGGSVRGIVAAATGRRYTGIDLRPEQVEANRAQAARLLGTTGDEATVDDPAALTPVQRHAGIWVKRDDLFDIDGSRGGKVRSCLSLLADAAPVAGVTTAGSRHSPQVNIVATIAARMGIPCRVHVPAGELTPELLAAQAAGAEIVQHSPGHNTVIIKRSRDDAAKRGWVDVPFGMECGDAIKRTAEQTRNLPLYDVQRIVVPVGSGMSLAGILRGLPPGHPPVVGVVVGADPSERLNRYAPIDWRDSVTLVQGQGTYDTPAALTTLGDLDLDPIYEAKCLPHLQPGDLLWIVGRRATAARTPISGPTPQWMTGDSVAMVDTLPADAFDLVFTCPPYYDLERYSDDPDDLSNMTTDDFDRAFATILAGCARALRPNRYAVIVVGDARDNRGTLRDLRGATVRAAEAAGLTFINGAVLITPVGSAAITAARGFVGTRTLTRTHQDVLVFAKGDRRAAATACGDVEVELPDPDDDGEGLDPDGGAS